MEEDRTEGTGSSTEASNAFAAPADAAPRVDPRREYVVSSQGGPSAATRRRRARRWSVVCALVGVPLMSYLALGLAKVTAPAGEEPGSAWIWSSVAVGLVAAAMLVSVFQDRWARGRDLTLVLMAPGLILCLLLIWAFGLGLVFLPGALVWTPALVACVRMADQQRAAALRAQPEALVEEA